MEELQTASGWSRLQFTAFDTINCITVTEAHREVLPQCLLLSRRLHQLWSPGERGSDLSRLNRSGGWVEVHSRTVQLLARAVEMAHLTNGRFDPAIGWATQPWRDKRARGELPIGEELHRPEQGWKSLCWEERRVWIPAQVKLDLGGIAKGAIADALTALLRARGVDCALIDLGGNIVVLGEREPGQSWRIGLRQPQKGRNEYFGIFDARACSVVTSAASERYVEADGQKYGHLLDSVSGASAESDLCSATVIAKDSTTADALSTACFVAGRAGAAGVLGRFPRAEAALLDRSGTLWLTEGLYQTEQLRLTDQSICCRLLETKGT